MISAPKPPYVAARWHGGHQDVIKWIVLHSAVTPCQDGMAQSVAEDFAHRPENNKASAHYAVDPHNRRQCVYDKTVAYHCGYNEGSIGVEMCEWPSQDIARWDDTAHRQLEVNTAHLVARLCLVYKVRPYYVNWLGLKAGIKGVTTHAEMSKAFKASSHWDPGAWRRLRFMREVRRHYRYLQIREDTP